MKLCCITVILLILPLWLNNFNGITPEMQISLQKQVLLNETMDRQLVLYSGNCVCWEQSNGIYYLKLNNQVVHRVIKTNSSYSNSSFTSPKLFNNTLAWNEASGNGSSSSITLNITSNKTMELKKGYLIFGVSEHNVLCYSNKTFYLFHFDNLVYRQIDADIKDVDELYMNDQFIVWQESINPNISRHYRVCYYDIEKNEKRIISNEDSTAIAPYICGTSIVWAEVKYGGNWYGNASIILYDIITNQSKRLLSNIEFDPYPNCLSIYEDNIVYKEARNSSLILYNITQNKSYLLTTPVYSINIWHNNIVYQDALGIYLLVFEFIFPPVKQDHIIEKNSMLLPVFIELVLIISSAIVTYYLLKRKKSLYIQNSLRTRNGHHDK